MIFLSSLSAGRADLFIYRHLAGYQGEEEWGEVSHHSATVPFEQADHPPLKRLQFVIHLAVPQRVWCSGDRFHTPGRQQRTHQMDTIHHQSKSIETFFFLSKKCVFLINPLVFQSVSLTI